MTSEERQALREKHKKRSRLRNDGTVFERWCLCGEDYWPCDTIEVLDAWEDEKQRILSVVDDDLRSSLKLTVINSILREVE